MTIAIVAGQVIAGCINDANGDCACDRSPINPSDGPVWPDAMDWVPEPGQFIVRHGIKCGECDDFIRKGDTAGYNNDEIVCEHCWAGAR